MTTVQFTGPELTTARAKAMRWMDQECNGQWNSIRVARNEDGTVTVTVKMEDYNADAEPDDCA